MCVCVRALGGGRLAVVLDSGDGGLAEEAVLVVHQVLVDAGSAEETGSYADHVIVCKQL